MMKLNYKKVEYNVDQHIKVERRTSGGIVPQRKWENTKWNSQLDDYKYSCRIVQTEYHVTYRLQKIPDEWTFTLDKNGKLAKGNYKLQISSGCQSTSKLQAIRRQLTSPTEKSCWPTTTSLDTLASTSFVSQAGQTCDWHCVRKKCERVDKPREYLRGVHSTNRENIRWNYKFMFHII